MPNEFGGREDLDAVAFLKELNELVHAREPGVLSAAEESTAWPGVSRPTYLGGLGFGLKWNMGWMHDTLAYFAARPGLPPLPPPRAHVLPRLRVHENFVLPLSHDEVVHGKGSLLRKMPGDRWQQLANLRAALRVHVGAPGQEAPLHGRRARPGGASGAQTGSLDWHLLERAEHAGVQALVRDLNRHLPARAGAVGGRLRARPASAGSSRTTRRRTCSRSCGCRPAATASLVCVCNLSPVPAGAVPRRAAARRRLARAAQHRLRPTAVSASATWAASRASRSRGTTSRSRPS